MQGSLDTISLKLCTRSIKGHFKCPNVICFMAASPSIVPWGHCPATICDPFSIPGDRFLEFCKAWIILVLTLTLRIIQNYNLVSSVRGIQGRYFLPTKCLWFPKLAQNRLDHPVSFPYLFSLFFVLISMIQDRKVSIGLSYCLPPWQKNKICVNPCVVGIPAWSDSGRPKGW